MIEDRQNNLQIQVPIQQKSEQYQIQIVDQSQAYTLTTCLHNQLLSIDLKVFDLKEDNVSFFQLQLTNQTMPSELKGIFDNLECLFNKCFLKKQNYCVLGNGRIMIKYVVQLESERMHRQFIIHLLSQQKTIEEVLRQIVKKERRIKQINGNFKIKNQQKQANEKCRQLQQKISKLNKQSTQRTIRINKILVPVINEYLHFFKINQNIITYQGKDSQFTKIVLRPDIVNQNQFEIQVQCIKKNTSTVIGIVSKQSFQKQYLNTNDESFSYKPFSGTISKNASEVKFHLLRSQPYSYVSVKMKISKQSKLITFSIKNYLGKMMSYEQNLCSLGDKKVFPFIAMYNLEEQVKVTFK